MTFESHAEGQEVCVRGRTKLRSTLGEVQGWGNSDINVLQRGQQHHGGSDSRGNVGHRHCATPGTQGIHKEGLDYKSRGDETDEANLKNAYAVRFVEEFRQYSFRFTTWRAQFHGFSWSLTVHLLPPGLQQLDSRRSARMPRLTLRPRVLLLTLCPEKQQ